MLIIFEKTMIKLLKDNKLLLKTRQRFKSERHSVFSEEINKVASSLNEKKWK